MLYGNKLFITGGAGFLGKSLIERHYGSKEITIFSRDEAKHYYIKKQYPNVRCIVGDVSDLDGLMRASKGHDVGIFAASLKQIEAVNDNYEVATRTIVHGAINSRRCAEENGFDSACFISSDKSRAATTLYGAMKFIAGELFIINAEQSNVKLSSAIYGNVMNSTGSIIPLIKDAIQKGYELQLYSEEMTRFMLTADEAMDTIEVALGQTGYNVVPYCRSFLVKDLFEICGENWGLKYVVTKPRISEKLHEIMIAKEEMPRVILHEERKHFLMHYKHVFNSEHFFKNNNHEEYSSKDYVISKEELLENVKPYFESK